MKLPKWVKDELETMMGSVGVNDMLSLMADICAEKAEHIRSNWQDDALAKAYDRAGKALDRLKTNTALQAIW